MGQDRQPSTDLGEFGIARLKQQSDGALVLITTETEVFGRLLKARDVAAVFAETGFVQTKRAKSVNAWVSEPVAVTAPRAVREKRSTAIKAFLDLIVDGKRLETVSGLIARRKAAIASTPITTGRIGDLVVSEAPGGFHLAPDHPEQSYNTIVTLLRRQGVWREAEKRWFVADGNRRILKKALAAYQAAATRRKPEPTQKSGPLNAIVLRATDVPDAELEVRETEQRKVLMTLKGANASASISLPWEEAAAAFGAFFATRSQGVVKPSDTDR